MTAEWHQDLIGFAIAAAVRTGAVLLMLRSLKPDPKWLLYMAIYRHLEYDPIRPLRRT